MTLALRQYSKSTIKDRLMNLAFEYGLSRLELVIKATLIFPRVIAPFSIFKDFHTTTSKNQPKKPQTSL